MKSDASQGQLKTKPGVCRTCWWWTVIRVRGRRFRAGAAKAIAVRTGADGGAGVAGDEAAMPADLVVVNMQINDNGGLELPWRGCRTHGFRRRKRWRSRVWRIRNCA